MVCDRSILSSVTSSLYFAGFLVGVFGLGFLSDMFGRRKIAFISVSLCAIVSLTASFSPNVDYFNFCRFMIGVFGGTYVQRCADTRVKLLFGYGIGVNNSVGYGIPTNIVGYRIPGRLCWDTGYQVWPFGTRKYSLGYGMPCIEKWVVPPRSEESRLRCTRSVAGKAKTKFFKWL